MSELQITLDEETWRGMRRELGRRHALRQPLTELIEDAMTWGEATAIEGEYNLTRLDVEDLKKLHDEMWPEEVNE